MHEPYDLVSNASSNASFSELVAFNLQRRRLLQSSLGASALARLGLLPGPGAGAPGRAAIAFQGVPVAADDAVHVPESYVAEVLYAWGDAVSDGPVFAPDASNTAADQEAVRPKLRIDHTSGLTLGRLPDLTEASRSTVAGPAIA